MNSPTPKEDAHEIVRRLTYRNPEFRKLVVEGIISLEDFAEIVIVQFKGFVSLP